MIIYLVRHTAYHNPDNIYPFHLPVHLSKEGREHAKQLALWHKKNNPPKVPIYSSPIVRCIQTAEIIASKTNSFVSIDKRLIETSCPDLQGKKQVKTKPWKFEDDDPSRESKDSLRERMLSIFEEKVNQNEPCILVTHGDPSTVLYYHLQNKKLPKYLWNPTNSSQVLNKGTTIKIEIENGKVINTTKINDYS